MYCTIYLRGPPSKPITREEKRREEKRREEKRREETRREEKRRGLSHFHE
jgi:hypothetical protein